MPFSSRSNSLRPIVSDKHEVTWSDLSADYSGATSKLLIDPVLPGAVSLSTEVGIGSRVFGVYIEFNVSSQVITNTKVLHWTVSMIRKGQTAGSPATYYQDDRSQVLKRGMEMLVKDTGTLIKRIIYVKIPRTFQRMKANQQIYINFRSTSSETLNSCGFAIYKEFK